MASSGVLDLIKGIIEEKEKNKKAPLFALMSELRVMYDGTEVELRNELNRLAREKKITHGITINDKYFKLT